MHLGYHATWHGLRCGAPGASLMLRPSAGAAITKYKKLTNLTALGNPRFSTCFSSTHLISLTWCTTMLAARFSSAHLVSLTWRVEERKSGTTRAKGRRAWRPFGELASN